MLLLLRLGFLAAGILGGSLTAAPADVVNLTDQLELARAAEDTYAEIELLRRLLEQQPEDTAARDRLIDLWLDVEDYTMAEAAIADWKDAPPDRVARVHAEALFYRDKKPDEAITVLKAHLASSEPDEQTLWDLASYLGQQKRWQEQLQVLDTSITIAPSADAYIERAKAKREIGDYAGAVVDARTARAIEPDSEEVKRGMPAFERLASALMSIESLSARLETNPSDLEALLLRSYHYRNGGIPSLALQDADAALRASPTSAYAKLLKARALSDTGDIDHASAFTRYGVDLSKLPEKLETANAIIAADAAIAAAPKDATAYRTRAYRLNGDPAQYALALEDAKAALAIDPASLEAIMEAVYACAMLGRSDDAGNYLRKLEEIRPPARVLAVAMGYVGEMYFRNYNTALALEFIDRSLELNETERMLRFKASCLQRIGRQKDAAATLERAEKLRSKRG